MKVIVIGCGRVGSGLARRLAMDGHAVAVVDQDEAAFRRLGTRFSGRRILGLGFDWDVLAEAGIERADALAAVTGADEVNAVVARVAARRFRVPRVVARMYDPRTAEVYRRLGVHTISPVAWGIGRLAELMILTEVGSVTSLGAGQVDVIEAVVPPGLDGRSLGEMEVPGEIRAAAVTRAGRTFVPDAVTRVYTDDIVSLAVTGGGAERLETLLGRR